MKWFIKYFKRRGFLPSEENRMSLKGTKDRSFFIKLFYKALEPRCSLVTDSIFGALGGNSCVPTKLGFLLWKLP